MGSLNAEKDSKQDMNDSGCVQDASVIENGYRGSAQLLELSDDVLLYILKYCNPRDLKALGHTCPRLGALVCDRTLWTRVDARSTPVGQKRLSWLITHCLSPATTELKLAGYANKLSRCLGIQDLQWPVEPAAGFIRGMCAGTSPGVEVEHFLLRMWYPHLPRFAVCPRWPDKEEADSKALNKDPEATTSSGESSSSSGQDSGSSGTKKKCVPMFEDEMGGDCKGPQFTLTAPLIKELRKKCSHLTSLTLEYCNIDYKTTSIRQFPAHLKKLCLRGTRCYNLPLNTSYLGKVQERLPRLEYLDVSECDWFEPASLMPLSKLSCLTELYMRDCKRLTECVAYASLATRYGFRKLRLVDVCGSPLADSEVSALGWLPKLEEFYCSPPDDLNSSTEHSHSWKDTTFSFTELENWEIEEPDYYKVKTPEPSEHDDEEDLKNEPEASDSTERDGDVLLGNPWWSHERRIIVIQPNANRQLEQRFPVQQRRGGPPAPGVPQPGHAAPLPERAAPRGGPIVPQPGPVDPQPGQAHPQEPAPGNAADSGEAGPSKRRADPEDPIDLAKRPRLDDDDDDDEDPQAPVPIRFPMNAEQCPRLRNMGLPAEGVIFDPPSRPRLVHFPRNDVQPMMHIDVDVQRQSTVHIGTHIGHHLVSDSAILRFGRAENDNINYVHIGRNGIHAGVEPGMRPDRSNLQVLSVTGYRNITDRSLEHLATAAPNLRLIDFSETNVSSRGVEVFKAMRPNCKVVFSAFGKTK